MALERCEEKSPNMKRTRAFHGCKAPEKAMYGNPYFELFRRSSHSASSSSENLDKAMALMHFDVTLFRI